MSALHSSSALVCNMFDYWRERGVAAIAAACGAGRDTTTIQFEQAYPTGLGGTAPHPDVTLGSERSLPTVIEAKFEEPYNGQGNSFTDSYFATRGIWSRLPACEALARAVFKGQESFVHLGAAQLLKHALGIARQLGARGFRLLYLWFEVPGTEAAAHRKEIGRFSDAVRADIEFDARTYQEVFADLRGARATPS